MAGQEFGDWLGSGGPHHGTGTEGAEKRSASRKKSGAPRTRHRLSATFVRTVTKKGTYADGGGLFLQVGIGGNAKSWILIYRRVRFGGDDSHERFIKALEHERRAIPQEGDRTIELFKIANAIIKEHERDYAAHEAAYKSGEREKSELVQAAERYAEDRRRGYVGLGPANTVSLAQARERAQECRDFLAHKPPIDPRIEFQRRAREQAKAHAKTKNFYEMAESYLDARTNDPDNPMHISSRKGREYQLRKYLEPLHDKLPAEITSSDIRDIIQPLRQKGRRSTAHTTRTFAHRVIEWSRANGAFPETVINPASMELGSPLRVLLNTESTNPVSKPLRALHFSKIPALFAKLELIKQRSDFTIGEAARAVGKSANKTIYYAIREGRLLAYKPDRPFCSRSMDQWWIKPAELFKVWPKVRDVIPGLPSVALYVLKYQILTAARPSEVLGMRWGEWEEDIQVWHVPWQRIKQGGRTRQDHYVPLSPPATAILEALRALRAAT
jgi:integrase